MSAYLNIATGAIDAGGWCIKDTYSSTRISIIDKAGRVIASVPRRGDDLDIARLIEDAPIMLDALTEIVRVANSNPFCTVGHTVEHGAPQLRELLAKHGRFP